MALFFFRQAPDVWVVIVKVLQDFCLHCREKIVKFWVCSLDEHRQLCLGGVHQKREKLSDCIIEFIGWQVAMVPLTGKTMNAMQVPLQQFPLFFGSEKTHLPRFLPGLHYCACPNVPCFFFGSGAVFPIHTINKCSAASFLFSNFRHWRACLPQFFHYPCNQRSPRRIGELNLHGIFPFFSRHPPYLARTGI